MSEQKLSVHIVTWNSAQYILDCLASLHGQTFQDFTVIIIDNGSRDDTIQLIKQEHPAATVLRNSKNLGFAKAHNQALKLSTSPLVCVMNDDVLLESGFLARAVAGFDAGEHIGSVTGKMLKLTQTSKYSTLTDKFAHAKVVDSCGLVVKKTGEVIDRGEGQQDDGTYDQRQKVFGPSGALALYRKKALVDISADEEYFDESFFMYKEDIDVAWRLQWRGWESIYIPEARALHRRTAAAKGRTLRDKVQGRKNKSRLTNQLSYLNHLRTMIKNVHGVVLLKMTPWMLVFEGAKALYMLLFETRTFVVVKTLLGEYGQLHKARKYIKATKKQKSSHVAKWVH